LGGTFGSTAYGAGQAGANPYATGIPPKKKKSAGPIVVAAVVLIAVAVAAWLIVPKILGKGGTTGGDESEPPISNPTTMTCPDPTYDTTTYEHPNDGWVHGGRLAVPRLTGDWSLPFEETGVAFGRDALHQFYTMYTGWDPKQPGAVWGASVLVGELYAGDGFFNPQEGAEIVTHCVLGTFYGDAVVTRNDTRNEAYPLDGYDGWIIQTTLSFEIENIPTTDEDVTIIVVATSEMTSSLYYSSVPQEAPESVKGDVKYTLDSLKVSD
jgi:hypothetical protein